MLGGVRHCPNAEDVLVTVNTGQNNEAIRLSTETIRMDPILTADYSNYLYVNNGGTLYKFDISDDLGNILIAKSVAGAGRYKILNPYKNELYFHSGAINTVDFAQTASFSGNPLFKSDGTELYTLDGTYINRYNAVSKELIERKRLGLRETLFKKTANDSTFIVYEFGNLYFVKNPFLN